MGALGTYTTTYGYDRQNRVVVMTYPDPSTGSGQAPEVVTTTYNAMGLPATLTGSLGQTYVADASYTPEGRPGVLSLGSSLQINHDYYAWITPDGRGRLQRLQAGPTSSPASLQNLSYTYDAVGNIKTITDNGQTTGFTYDDLDRLTGVSGAYSAGYTYNAIGNLLSKDGLNYEYDPAHPHAVKYRKLNGVVQESYTYDANGNMTARAGDSLTYDPENRLESVTSGGETVSFVYDGDGRRVLRDTITGTIAYVGPHYELRFDKLPMAEDLDDDCWITVIDTCAGAGIMRVSARWGGGWWPGSSQRRPHSGCGEYAVGGTSMAGAGAECGKRA